MVEEACGAPAPGSGGGGRGDFSDGGGILQSTKEKRRCVYMMKLSHVMLTYACRNRTLT